MRQLRPRMPALALAMMLVGAAVARAETRRALLIGIDTYTPTERASTRSSADGGRDWFDLEGAVNDAVAMREILIARFAFKPDDVHILTNGEATRERIFHETQHWLIDAAQSGDVSFFYFAGHGSQVRNSRSAEVDKLDESIVPADSHLGAPDIRDKELARLFHRALDKNISLTAAFDSCHSGSIARGLAIPRRVRKLSPVHVDVAEPPDPGPRPEDRDALILSAAQDFQLASETRDHDGTIQGLFTWAFVKVLRSIAVNESADRVFLRVRAMMQAGDTPQEPSLAGTVERRRRPFFGLEAPAESGRTVAAIQQIDADGTVVIQAGLAAGLRAGCELSKVTSDVGHRPVLRVLKSEGLSRSRATIVGGHRADVRPGDLFEITRWAPAPASALRVWIGHSNLPYHLVARHGRDLMRASSEAGIRVVNDPTTQAPTDVATTFTWSGTGWQLRRGIEPLMDLGPTPDAATLHQLVTSKAPRSSAIVNLPVPTESAKALRLDANSAGGLIALADAEADADYVLVGRTTTSGLEYAWVRPNASAVDALRSALPARSDWIRSQGSGDATPLAAALHQYAVRLATIHAWLQLEAPPDVGQFPYRLALSNQVTGELKTSGTNVEGERYRAVLTLDQTAASPGLSRRYVYVFAFDSAGASTLLFPSQNASRDENYLPVGVDNVGRLPARIDLPGSDLTISAPFGVDTFVLLTTATALPDPGVLTGDPVQTRSQNPNADVLTRLFTVTGLSTRGPTAHVPSEWSIERLTLGSRPVASVRPPGQR